MALTYLEIKKKKHFNNSLVKEEIVMQMNSLRYLERLTTEKWSDQIYLEKEEWINLKNRIDKNRN